ncbi:hypothetical protein LWI28_018627 [Acer negundo]|uniref:Uncharacterized protein n=1 Tax=Acer negundo TaxID=4023 RepID=A0AAD5JEI6_ACENE|nr:hypothetical protein LWI28_018627 [Acer negundo]
MVRKQNGKLLGLYLGDKNIGACVGLFPRFKALPHYGKVFGTSDPFVLLKRIELGGCKFVCLVKTLVKFLNVYDMVFGYPNDERYRWLINLCEMVKKQNGKLLGLDIGDKNIGVCVDLFSRFKALPLYGKVFSTSNPSVLLRRTELEGCLFPRFKTLPLYGKVFSTSDPFVILRRTELDGCEFVCLVKTLVKFLNVCGMVFGYPNDERYYWAMNLFEMTRKWNGKLLDLDIGDKNIYVCVCLFHRFKALLHYGKVYGTSDPFVLLRRTELEGCEFVFLVKTLVKFLNVCGMMFGYPNDERYHWSMNLFEMARKQNGKLLSLDLGDKNIGVYVGLFPRFKTLPLYGKVLRTSNPFILLRRTELEGCEFVCLVKTLVKFPESGGIEVDISNFGD